MLAEHESQGFGVALARGHAPLRQKQALADGRNPAAFIRRQVNVAGAHGQAVGLAEDGHSHQLRIQVKVARHAPQYGQLLPVLLAEHGHLGLHKVQKLQHHGAHAPEVHGARSSAQALGHLRHLHPGGVVRLVHGSGFGRENRVRAVRLSQRQIAGQVARVAVQVLVRSELRGVYEHAHHQLVGAGARVVDEAHVAVVQESHCGHQGDALALFAPLAALRA